MHGQLPGKLGGGSGECGSLDMCVCALRKKRSRVWLSFVCIYVCLYGKGDFRMGGGLASARGTVPGSLVPASKQPHC